VKKTTIAVVYATMAAGAIHLLAITGIVISIFVKDNTPIDEVFALYKNTRFEECAAMIPDAARCNAIRNIRVDYLEGIDKYIRRSVLDTSRKSTTGARPSAASMVSRSSRRRRMMVRWG
jgi:hypothetical protein